MGWSVPSQNHRIFQRNPLVGVVVELRFAPILKVPDRIADFQEQVRGTFPEFQDVTRQMVTLNPPAAPEVREDRVFAMLKTDGSGQLALSTSSLSLESHRHEHRRGFIGDAKVGLDALLRVHSSVLPIRLGLRYVNVIDKKRIAADLGRETSWSSLLATSFLSVPTGLADLEGTTFACEVASPMPSGAQTVRYALLQDGDGEPKFRLDVDRYVEGPVDLSGIVSLLEQFADDIFAVFTAAMGPDLRAWMPER